MPTTDPVKRRKQNCENQKRWRQRQLDSLQRLGAALDHSENRVKVLESESDELRTALRNALAEVDRLRAREGIIDQQTPLSGFNRIASIPADDVSLAGSTATTAASIGNTSSTIQLAELSLDRARTSSSSIGTATFSRARKHPALV
jgi:predicted nuclease with TOPRIM domain